MKNIILNILVALFAIALLAWCLSGFGCAAKGVDSTQLDRIEQALKQSAGRDAKSTNYNIIGDNNWIAIVAILATVPLVTYVLPKLVWNGTSKAIQRRKEWNGNRAS